MAVPRYARVAEHLKRALALVYRDLERLSGLRVGDRHRHLVVVSAPQQPDADPVACTRIEFAVM